MSLAFLRLIRTGSVALFMILVGACAVMLSVETLTNTPWVARQVELSALQDWTLMGRIAIIDNQDGWHANLHWTQRGEAYSVELIGPLGQGRIKIQGNQAGVSVRTADGQVFADEDPARLLARTVGVRIPIEGLSYWIRGLPDPSRLSELQGDQQGRLLRIEQDGWVIEYPDYTQVMDLALPGQIRARRGDLSLKLIVKTWELQSRPQVTVLPGA